MDKVISIVRLIFKKFGIGLAKYDTLELLRKNEGAAQDVDFMQSLSDEIAINYLRNLKNSKSQIRQDLFVLTQLNFKRNGYFIEFGATNGVGLSNTYLLEKDFGWTGILAEPAKCWHQALEKNRSAIIEKKCVWKDSSSILNFNEVEYAELSTINSYSSSDLHKNSRKGGKTYNVETISLNDLLEKHGAPATIDYLSIDTEGSEYEILSNFDFSKHCFRVITCEHNFTPMREELFKLLTKNGYKRIYEEMSKFDDWYVLNDPR